MVIDFPLERRLSDKTAAPLTVNDTAQQFKDSFPELTAEDQFNLAVAVGVARLRLSQDREAGHKVEVIEEERLSSIFWLIEKEIGFNRLADVEIYIDEARKARQDTKRQLVGTLDS